VAQRWKERRSQEKELGLPGRCRVSKNRRSLCRILPEKVRAHDQVCDRAIAPVYFAAREKNRAYQIPIAAGEVQQQRAAVREAEPNRRVSAGMARILVCFRASCLFRSDARQESRPAWKCS